MNESSEVCIAKPAPMRSARGCLATTIHISLDDGAVGTLSCTPTYLVEIFTTSHMDGLFSVKNLETGHIPVSIIASQR